MNATITIEDLIVIHLTKINFNGEKRVEINEIKHTLSDYIYKRERIMVKRGTIRYEDPDNDKVVHVNHKDIYSPEDFQEIVLKIRRIVFMAKFNDFKIMEEWIRTKTLPEFGEGVTVQFSE